MNVKFQVIKNRNPKAKSAGVPDINTLPCALAILPSTRRPRGINPFDFTRSDECRDFHDRIGATEAKERRDGAA